MRNILPLTDNFVFKAIFSQNPDLLLDLLNSFPEFQENKNLLEARKKSMLVYNTNLYAAKLT
ncbi:MAG: hypothetical protein SFU98_15285 [Leptospiraceae bacterium]|nr:hypothetical protein [Leptospiraceae bacterium]